MKKDNMTIKSFYLLVLVVLAIGFFFRVVNIEYKSYWKDEVYTSLRVSGYTERELKNRFYNSIPFSYQDFQEYQYPNSQKNVVDTMRGLAKEEAQLPPLYFVMVRFWVKIFGHSIAASRSLSVIFSLLTLVVLYLLCKELFKSEVVAGMAIALVAISPIHVLYAQESRPYSLWTFTSLLSSWLLLRSMRLPTKFHWGFYCLASLFGLYGYLYSLFVSIVQGIYVVIVENFKFNDRTRNYLITLSIAWLGFLPWIIIILVNYANLSEATDWVTENLSNSIPELIYRSLINSCRIFVDFGVPKYILWILMIFAGYAVYFLCRNTNRSIWLLVICLISTGILANTLPDLIFGGRRSAVTRYFLTSYLGIQIAVAYTLSCQIFSPSLKLWQQRIWRIVTIAIFSLGIVSCFNSSQAYTWWHKSNQDRPLPQVAAALNRANKPLIISDGKWFHLVSLHYLLAPKIQFQLEGNSDRVPQLANNFSDYFFYKITTQLTKTMQEKASYVIKPVISQNQQVVLWRVENKL